MVGGAAFAIVAERCGGRPWSPTPAIGRLCTAPHAPFYNRNAVLSHGRRYNSGNCYHEMGQWAHSVDMYAALRFFITKT